jgi:hypothetical protein
LGISTDGSKRFKDGSMIKYELGAKVAGDGFKKVHTPLRGEQLNHLPCGRDWTGLENTGSMSDGIERSLYRVVPGRLNRSRLTS